MKGGRHYAIVERTRKLLGSKKRRRRQTVTLASRRQRGGGVKDFSSYSVPVLDMAGNIAGEYMVDKLFAKMKRRKKQKGGGVGRLAEGIKKLDSAVQTTNRLALATLLGSLATTGAYKVYNKRKINRQKGGSNGWDKLFTW